jgi:hypothetical protein
MGAAPPILLTVDEFLAGADEREDALRLDPPGIEVEAADLFAAE